ncbi:hypothetical protein I316_04451 [Kwoniella heveanensis BCC8398]|uniref:Zn(2)-C6 fungal-type domain-containing protein n=1 Tax=Kwoniella heveanensis BCC8398 TaxID=1296120 RepID=A0A1B9GRN2_9TREE|nr:hypothetical protein I316_04451 [Kwoniella heveanensis BCC8398]
MYRHYSDTTYTPLKPSRLNPDPDFTSALNPIANYNINNDNNNLDLTLGLGGSGGCMGDERTSRNMGTISGNNILAMRPSRGLPIGVMQRGTVSMPTSPVLKKMQMDTMTVNTGLGLGLGLDLNLNAGVGAEASPIPMPMPLSMSISPITPGTPSLSLGACSPGSGAGAGVGVGVGVGAGVGGRSSDPFGVAAASTATGNAVLGLGGGDPKPWDGAVPHTAQAFYNPPTQNGMDALHSALLPPNVSPFDFPPLMSTAPPGNAHCFERGPGQDQGQGQSQSAFTQAQDGHSAGVGSPRVKVDGNPPKAGGSQPSLANRTDHTRQPQPEQSATAPAHPTANMDLDADPVEGIRNHSGATGAGADQDQDQDVDMGVGIGMGLGPGGRRKRIQVRIACTHCQKACKKCSNTRPCERCVKYGLPDCIDSSRKPRKTGIKRGPYKRRSSRYEAASAASIATPTSTTAYPHPPPPPNTTQSSFTGNGNGHGNGHDDSTGSAVGINHQQLRLQQSNNHNRARHQVQMGIEHHPHRHHPYAVNAKKGVGVGALNPNPTHYMNQERRRSSALALGKDAIYGGFNSGGGAGRGNGTGRPLTGTSSNGDGGGGGDIDGDAQMSTVEEDHILHHHHAHDPALMQAHAQPHHIDTYSPFPRPQHQVLALPSLATAPTGLPFSLTESQQQQLDGNSSDGNRRQEGRVPPHPSVETKADSNSLSSMRQPGTQPPVSKPMAIPPSFQGGQSQQESQPQPQPQPMLQPQPEALLAQALSTALSEPQTTWINGQRQPIPLASARGPTASPSANGQVDGVDTATFNGGPSQQQQQQQNGPQDGDGYTLSGSSSDPITGTGDTDGGTAGDRGGMKNTHRNNYDYRHHRPSPLYPRTPVGRFPFSLGGGAGDPFSRAVSPIKGIGEGKLKGVGDNSDSDSATERLKMCFGGPSTGASAGASMRMSMSMLPGLVEELEPISPTTCGLASMRGDEALSGIERPAATSPRNGMLSNIEQMSSGQAQGSTLPPAYVRSQANAQAQSAAQQTTAATTATALKPDHFPFSSSSSSTSSLSSVLPFPLPPEIRKPSLRTLISTSSTNTSRAPSPSPASAATANPVPPPPMPPMTSMSPSKTVTVGSQHGTTTTTTASATPIDPSAQKTPFHATLNADANANVNTSNPFGVGLGVSADRILGSVKLDDSKGVAGAGLSLNLNWSNFTGLRGGQTYSYSQVHDYGIGFGYGHGGPGPGDQSPTLFSGPMSLDDDEDVRV